MTLNITSSIRYDIYLDGSECETCGWNPEEIEVEVNLNTMLVDLGIRVGCYGGASLYNASIDEACKELEDWVHLDPDVKKIIKKLRKLNND